MVITILFCKGCIIQANQSDYHNDILAKSDIKKINLNLEDAKFDIQHNKEPITGCRIVENTITETPTLINGIIINSGSWIMTIEIDNPYLENLILNGETQPDGSLLLIRGFSLFSFANGAETYNEVRDKSDVYPIYVSFVQDPANQLPFEVYDSNAYISKSSDNMANDNEKSFLEKLKALIASEESTEPETGEVSKEAKPTEEKPTTEPAPASNAEPQTPAPSTQPPKDGEVAKACGDNKDVSKAATPEPTVPAGTKMETQTEQATPTPTAEPLTKDDIPAIVAAVCEALGCEEEEDEPVDNGESEEKKYIVKQATIKEDTIVTPVKETKPIFDMFGRKL
jgi:hypothetical protein